ncbi:hypothetical protein PanWU01x14_064320 [Parasponia andersonii]|uniref:Cotton fiber protein n=1 Tax=Parasponia andersonii TaxID=3476 RepID=A0A2P5DHC1_PARAD|nr:hypothetical protein PanWU01x14_064320 [Parasponia andersonii]
MQERKEEVVIADPVRETPETELQIVAKNEMNNNLGITPQEEEDIQEKRIVVCEENKTSNQQAKTYRQSNKSKKAKRVGMDESYDKKSDQVLRRSETKLVDQENYVEDDDNNEFSTMSDEDLNIRVEEFIQRFNRRIRLQARAYNN